MQEQQAGRAIEKTFVHGSTVEQTRFYMGSLMTTLASTTETGNGFALLEYRSTPGHEPPSHIHINQDELLYILDGEIEAYCQDQVVKVASGQCIFLPRNFAHAWYVDSPELRMLILTQPGGVDEYFRAMSAPATSMTLPSSQITYLMDNPEHAFQVGIEHGIRNLGPDETKRYLPQYPGFGATAVWRQLFFPVNDNHNSR